MNLKSISDKLEEKYTMYNSEKDFKTWNQFTHEKTNCGHWTKQKHKANDILRNYDERFVMFYCEIQQVCVRTATYITLK